MIAQHDEVMQSTLNTTFGLSPQVMELHEFLDVFL